MEEFAKMSSITRASLRVGARGAANTFAQLAQRSTNMTQGAIGEFKSITVEQLEKLNALSRKRHLFERFGCEAILRKQDFVRVLQKRKEGQQMYPNQSDRRGAGPD
jgi:hypothetical protein